MPAINLQNLAQDFSMDDSGSADFASFVSSNSTSYRYRSSDGHVITLVGSGIAVDGSNLPISGTVTEIRIDLGNDNGVIPDVWIFDLSFAITDLQLNTAANENLRFWEVVLDGAAQFSLPDGFAVRFSGDGPEWSDDRLVGGDDHLLGDDQVGTYLRGDVRFLASDGMIMGGDDTLSGAFDVAAGDVYNMQGATVVGGADLIELDVDWTADPVLQAYGDVGFMTDSSVYGGNDVINLSASVTGTGAVDGDVSAVEGQSLLIGGHDLIHGSNSVTIYQDVLAGDARSVSNNSAAYGGNDTLYGLDGNDLLYGDFQSVNGSSIVRGGDDSLIGGAGADRIYGDYRTVSGTATTDGGNDFLSGQDGNDSLYGNEGNDTLNGGAGNDLLDGGVGNDWVEYTEETSGAGIRLDGVATFGSAGGDTITSIENAIGSAHDDTIVGNAGENYLIGGEGEDSLFGLDDSDTLDGGLGNDELHGQDGNDVLIGSEGLDTLNGGAGQDTVDYRFGSNGGGVRLDGGGNWGMAAGDSFVDIEHIATSDYRDVAVGSNSDNRIETRGGNDTVFALDGNDTLIGGTGDDALYGQGGNDQFVFADGFGHDTIYGFAAFDGNEDIDLSGVSEITDFSDLQSNHMTQVGADVVIDDGLGNTITLTNTNIASLDATDFVF